MKTYVKTKTYAEAATELLNPYIQDPGLRSLDESGECRYNGINGKHCVFAMACVDPSTLDETPSAVGVIKEYGTEILKPEYQHLTDTVFWQELQDFHDWPEYWTEKGLSQEGLKSYVELMFFATRLDK